MNLISFDFFNFTLIDLLDIIVVAYLFFFLFRTLKGSIATQIFLGLLIILLLLFLAKALNMVATSFIMKLITDIWVIAFVILFQPELRRLLIAISQIPLFRIFLKNEYSEVSDEIINAVRELSDKLHGALIVLSRTTGLKGVSETGVPLNAKVTKQLILSIFYPRSPLHDGAVIIKNGIIEAARCTLPLSSKSIFEGFSLGMRHKAALGITELSDAFVIIVSEETGLVSIAENGNLIKGISFEQLKNRINAVFSSKISKNFVKD